MIGKYGGNMSIFDDIRESIENFFKEFTRNYNQSTRWKEYKLGMTRTHCLYCMSRENKIYEYNDGPELPEHDGCACYLQALRTLYAGTATKLGENGADYYLKYFGHLPNYYITKEQAKLLGWVSWKGNLDKVAPGKMIGGNVFKNKEQKLPGKVGRIWYECDIDYQGGYRNNYRIIYSNDGLIFMTDRHYNGFVEIA